MDRLLETLADERRRHVRRCLSEHETPITLADLANDVAVRERETRLSAVSPEETKRIYVALSHTQVPKLVDAGLVTYE